MEPEIDSISEFYFHVHIQLSVRYAATGGGRLCPVANEPTRVPRSVATTSETTSDVPWMCNTVGWGFRGMTGARLEV